MLLSVRIYVCMPLCQMYVYLLFLLCLAFLHSIFPLPVVLFLCSCCCFIVLLPFFRSAFLYFNHSPSSSFYHFNNSHTRRYTIDNLLTCTSLPPACTDTWRNVQCRPSRR